MIFLEKTYKGRKYAFYVQRDQQALWVHFEGRTWLWKPEHHKITESQKEKKLLNVILSSIPGKIQKICVKKQDSVVKGQLLLLLSAMKIEYSFKAQANGIVQDIFCKVGDNVQAKKELIKLKYNDSKKHDTKS